MNSQSWIIFTLSATILWAGTNILDKYILSKLVKNAFVPLVTASLIGVIAALGIFYSGKTVIIPLSTLSLAIIAGIAYAMAILLYFKAVQIADISKVVALWYLTPAFTAFFSAIFLNEAFAVVTYLGIALLIIGALMIETTKLEFSLSKSAKIMILSSIFLSISYVSTKIALGKSDYWTIFAWGRIGTFLAVIPIYYMNKKQISMAIAKLSNKGLALLTLSEASNIAGIALITVASSVGFITLISAFESIQPLWVLIVSTFFSVFFPKIIKEVVNKKTLVRKLVATLMIVLGAFLVANS